MRRLDSRVILCYTEWVKKVSCFIVGFNFVNYWPI